MDNGIQTECSEITLAELRKITWDYAENTIVGCHQNNVIKVYNFEVTNPGDIHPLTIQECNVAEGWVEHIVCESYPDIHDASFFNEARIKRDKNGDILRNRVYREVVVDLLDARGNVVLTLSRE